MACWNNKLAKSKELTIYKCMQNNKESLIVVDMQTWFLPQKEGLLYSPFRRALLWNICTRASSVLRGWWYVVVVKGIWCGDLVDELSSITGDRVINLFKWSDSLLNPERENATHYHRNLETMKMILSSWSIIFSWVHASMCVRDSAKDTASLAKSLWSRSEIHVDLSCVANPVGRDDNITFVNSRPFIENSYWQHSFLIQGKSLLESLL